MNIKIKKVYYCEFCNKHSLVTLAKHEKSCTLNASRECKMCKIMEINDYEKVNNAVIQAINLTPEILESGTNLIKIPKSLYKDIECPACLSSIVRRVLKHGKKYGLWFEFTELDLKEYWKGTWSSLNTTRGDYE